MADFRGDLNSYEIYAFWQAIEKSQLAPDRKITFKLLFATGGQRVREVIQAEWAEFSLSEGLWTLPSSRVKNKRVHVVPLGSLALSLLQELQEYDNQSRHLFPNQSNPDQPMKDDALAQCLTRMNKPGVQPFQSRDIRRTCKTLMGKIGITKEVRDRLHNHALDDVSSRHYDRYDYLLEKRSAISKWNDYLSRIIAGNWQSDNLIQFSSKKETAL